MTTTAAGTMLEAQLARIERNATRGGYIAPSDMLMVLGMLAAAGASDSEPSTPNGASLTFTQGDRCLAAACSCGVVIGSFPPDKVIEHPPWLFAQWERHVLTGCPHGLYDPEVDQ